jgi:hypothetical protein
MSEPVPYPFQVHTLCRLATCVCLTWYGVYRNGRFASLVAAFQIRYQMCLPMYSVGSRR